MTSPPHRRSHARGRRRFLRTFGLTLTATLAGCASDPERTDTDAGNGDSPDGGAETRVGETATSREGTPTATPEPETPGSETERGHTPTRTPDEEPTGTPAATDLDLREANVTAVEFEGENGSYRFDVTLYHDDDGEDGYADWWQVESLGGEQLGRRTLLHAHSTAPFTRSETIDVPAGITCVVVRGHDQTHGYGGRAMLVNFESGATRPVDQGSERSAVDDDDCP